MAGYSVHEKSIQIRELISNLIWIEPTPSDLSDTISKPKPNTPFVQSFRIISSAVQFDAGLNASVAAKSVGFTDFLTSATKRSNLSISPDINGSGGNLLNKIIENTKEYVQWDYFAGPV